MPVSLTSKAITREALFNAALSALQPAVATFMRESDPSLEVNLKALKANFSAPAGAA